MSKVTEKNDIFDADFISYAYSPIDDKDHKQRIKLPKKSIINIYGTREIKVVNENNQNNKIIRKQIKSNIK